MAVKAAESAAGGASGHQATGAGAGCRPQGAGSGCHQLRAGAWGSRWGWGCGAGLPPCAAGGGGHGPRGGAGCRPRDAGSGWRQGRGGGGGCHQVRTGAGGTGRTLRGEGGAKQAVGLVLRRRPAGGGAQHDRSRLHGQHPCSIVSSNHFASRVRKSQGPRRRAHAAALTCFVAGWPPARPAGAGWGSVRLSAVFGRAWGCSQAIATPRPALRACAALTGSPAVRLCGRRGRQDNQEQQEQAHGVGWGRLQGAHSGGPRPTRPRRLVCRYLMKPMLKSECICMAVYQCAGVAGAGPAAAVGSFAPGRTTRPAPDVIFLPPCANEM